MLAGHSPRVCCGWERVRQGRRWPRGSCRAVFLGGAATSRPDSTGPPLPHPKDTMMETAAAAHRPRKGTTTTCGTRDARATGFSIAHQRNWRHSSWNRKGPELPPHLSRELNHASATGQTPSKSVRTRSRRAAAPTVPSGLSRPLLSSFHPHPDAAGSVSINRTCPSPHTEHRTRPSSPLGAFVFGTQAALPPWP